MTNLSLRDVPDELYQKIKEIADRERRSINQQILVLLEQSVQQQQKGPKAEVLERIDRRRKAIAARVGIMPDSTEQIAEERNR
ncbi:Arc family DNA-binding protein [Pleurocapsales cyanobacterium LEGE 06147]|nr:Arc family DNA-binding protein [Pleurocapsales cyanobacterium LEGE 06147]